MAKYEATSPNTGIENQQPSLNRRLSLPLLVLYGLGVTIGAGIYVLIGGTAAKAGYFAPVSFLLAAIVVAFTGFSYTELATRFPVSAGEAVYVKKGFNSSSLSFLIGGLVILSGVVSSAAVALGAAAYLHAYIPIPEKLLVAGVILIVGFIAIFGIFESVLLAALVTLIELGGLGMVIYFGFILKPDLLADIPLLLPPFEMTAWAGILSASLLAFFAFVGFEDIANVAEEVKNPRKTLPLGILLTLFIATLIYFSVVSVVILAVPMTDLTQSSAPLTLLFSQAPIWVKGLFGVIAFFATINGALIQIIMASRVLYGLAKQETLPAFLSQVYPVTRTPVNASLVIIAIVLIFAYALPIIELAEMTSTVVLIVFSIVNVALINLKRKEKTPPGSAVFTVPIWVPTIGFLVSLSLLLTRFLF